MKYATDADIAKLGTIVGVWAHPDDESWWCSGLFARAIKNGQKVVCITATKGDAGQTADDNRWPQQQLSKIRQSEMANALRAIGVDDLRWLEYQDGQLASVDRAEAVAKLERILTEVNADTIVTFESQGVTGHDDHKTVSKWACLAATQSSRTMRVYGACETTERYNGAGQECDESFDMYFNTQQPMTIPETQGELVLRLSPSEIQKKLNALKAHESQTSQFFDSAVGRRYFEQLCATECFIQLQLNI